MIREWLVSLQKFLLHQEKENLGYELRICNRKERSFRSIRTVSLQEAFELVSCDRYDHNYDVIIYNLNTNYFIKIHDHTSSKCVASDG